LAGNGQNVVVVDRRHVASVSTAARTSLLQYEIDTPLHRLIEKVGEEKAVKSYLLCPQSIYEIEGICKKLGAGTLFQRRPSVQYASNPGDLELLTKEYEARKKAGIPVRVVDEEFLTTKFGFQKAGGLL
jgi:hypothetical protein